MQRICAVSWRLVLPIELNIISIVSIIRNQAIPSIDSVVTIVYQYVIGNSITCDHVGRVVVVGLYDILVTRITTLHYYEYMS